MQQVSQAVDAEDETVRGWMMDVAPIGEAMAVRNRPSSTARAVSSSKSILKFCKVSAFEGSVRFNVSDLCWLSLSYAVSWFDLDSLVQKLILSLMFCADQFWEEKCFL
jgi:hypothetical protein